MLWPGGSLDFITSGSLDFITSYEPHHYINLYRVHVMLPNRIKVVAVSRSIKCDKAERTQFSSEVISFQQKYASNTKSLAFDGWYISLYIIARQIRLVPFSELNCFKHCWRLQPEWSDARQRHGGDGSSSRPTKWFQGGSQLGGVPRFSTMCNLISRLMSIVIV